MSENTIQKMRRQVGANHEAVAERSRGQRAEVDQPLHGHSLCSNINGSSIFFSSDRDNARSLFTSPGTKGQPSQQSEKSFVEICGYRSTQQQGRHSAPSFGSDSERESLNSLEWNLDDLEASKGTRDTRPSLLSSC